MLDIGTSVVQRVDGLPPETPHTLRAVQSVSGTRGHAIWQQYRSVRFGCRVPLCSFSWIIWWMVGAAAPVRPRSLHRFRRRRPSANAHKQPSHSALASPPPPPLYATPSSGRRLAEARIRHSAREPEGRSPDAPFLLILPPSPVPGRGIGRVSGQGEGLPHRRPPDSRDRHGAAAAVGSQDRGRQPPAGTTKQRRKTDLYGHYGDAHAR